MLWGLKSAIWSQILLVPVHNQQTKKAFTFRTEHTNKNTMLLRNFVIVAVILASDVAAIRTERGSLIRKAEELKERALKDDESCPKSDVYEEYYNALFELDDKGGALAACSDDDYFRIGELIRDITVEVDNNFPDIDSPETADVIDIKTHVCEMPCVWGVTNNTVQNHRKLATASYTYKSGGTCRSCRSNRVLNEIKSSLRRLSDYPPAEESAHEACELLEVCEFAFSEAKVSLQKVQKVLDKMVEAATNEDYIKKCADVEKIAGEMEEDMMEMVDYISYAKAACNDATKAVTERDGKKASDCLKDAEEASDDAMKCLKKVNDGMAKAKEEQRHAQEQLMKAEFKAAKERVKQVIENVKAVNEKRLEWLNKEIEKKEEAVKLANSLGDAQKMSKEQAALEELKLQEKQEKKALEAAEKEYQESLENEQQYAKELSKLMMDAQYAPDYEGIYRFLWIQFVYSNTYFY